VDLSFFVTDVRVELGSAIPDAAMAFFTAHTVWSCPLMNGTPWLGVLCELSGKSKPVEFLDNIVGDGFG